MEAKRNEATLNRPQGDRVLDASYVFINLPAFIRQMKKEEAWGKNDRNGITVFKTDKLCKQKFGRNYIWSSDEWNFIFNLFNSSA